MPQLALGEGIDDGAPEPHGEEVVDECPNQGAEGAEEHHEPYLHAAATFGIGSHIDGRWDDHL